MRNGFFINGRGCDGIPRRIVSLVPSQTELLHALGLDEEVVGISKFCIYPKSWKGKTKIGGTKRVRMDVIRRLKPDLIIANKEENTKEDAEKLGEIAPTWVSDISTLEEAYAMIQQVGRLTGKEEKANQIVARAKENFGQLKPLSSPKSVAYLIWRNPWMAVAANTFIDDLFATMGLHNVFADKSRYPEFNVSELIERRPALVFLSSEPFPFEEKHASELRSLGVQSEMMLVDGEYFSWYGSRLVDAPAYFQTLLAQIEAASTFDP